MESEKEDISKPIVTKKKMGRPRNHPDPAMRNKIKMLRILKKIWENPTSNTNEVCNSAELYSILMGWKNPKITSTDGVTSVEFVSAPKNAKTPIKPPISIVSSPVSSPINTPANTPANSASNTISTSVISSVEVLEPFSNEEDLDDFLKS